MKIIMIVDGEQFSHDFYIEMLEDTDCEVISAYDSKDALSKLRKNRPDLIVMDKSIFSERASSIMNTEDKFLRGIKNIPVIIAGDLFLQVILVQTFLTNKAEGLDYYKPDAS